MKDITAPANFVSLAGFCLTLIGSLHLNTPEGVAAVAAGRLCDIIDGPVARRTHSSRFGAVLDATLDKLAILCIVLGLLVYNLAPVWVLAYILAQNLFVAAINILAAWKKIVVQTVITGKRNVFLQNTTMVLFAVAHISRGTLQAACIVLAYGSLFVSLFYALRASVAYFAHHRKA